jgi:hypothetical protein
MLLMLSGSMMTNEGEHDINDMEEHPLTMVEASAVPQGDGESSSA